MPTILLIRHGQASFGGDDYDVLSPVGVQQCVLVARELAGRDLDVARLVSGSLHRQRDTALATAELLDRPVTVDARFDEYAMDDILAHHSASAVRASRPPGSDRPAITSAQFQDLLEEAMTGWIAAGADGPAAETWPAFAGRVREGVRDVAAGLPSGSTALVFTSGGAIAAACVALLDLPDGALIAFNRVAVNAAITKIISGRRGVTLVSFNEHRHLEGHEPPLVTYR